MDTEQETTFTVVVTPSQEAERLRALGYVAYETPDGVAYYNPSEDNDE